VLGPFERFIGVDWSGASSPRGQQVYVAEAHRQDARVTLHSVIRARDRSAVEEFLRGGPLEPAPAWREWPGPGQIDRRKRRLVALDFAFGFPAAFEHPELAGAWTWDDLGRWADMLDPGRDGDGSPLEPVRSAITANQALRRQFRLAGGDSIPTERYRATDRSVEGARPESVFHLVGPSQVGVGSITGIAMLHRLREVERIAVWPFHARERIAAAGVVLVEIFPRMWLDPRIRKSELPERVRQLEAWEREGVAFRTKAELAAASSGDALDAAAAAIGAARSCYLLPEPELLPEEARRREGWIVGVQVPE
jgi:hypothetical protein